MPKTRRSTPFAGDIAAQVPVLVERKEGAFVVTLAESEAKQLGLIGGDLAAATVSFGDGKTLLLMAPAGRGLMQVTRCGSNHLPCAQPLRAKGQQRVATSRSTTRPPLS